MTRHASISSHSFDRRLFARAAIVAATAATLGLGASQALAQPVNLTIGSFAQGSSWYVYSVNLGEMLRAALPAGSSVDTPPLAGGLGNPPMVASGKAQLAFGMAVVGSWALEGNNAYKTPLKDLRGLVGGWDTYYLVPMARGASPSKDLGDYFKTVNPKATVTLPNLSDRQVTATVDYVYPTIDTGTPERSA